MREIPGHEYRDHTSEITLVARGRDWGDLMAETAAAFAGLATTSGRVEADPLRREYESSGADRVAALVGWLNELVYWAEMDGWIPQETVVEMVEGTDDFVARARGLRLGRPFVLVKAATLHDATVREIPGGLEAKVTLDI